MNKVSVIKYDNTFNKTSLSLLTKVESDILLSVLSRMGGNIDDKERYVADFSFNEIRDMVGSNGLQKYRIKKILDTLLDTKVEFFHEKGYQKANLFSHYDVTDGGKARIILTSHMTNKLITNAKEYTILDLNEYIKLPSNYSKEIYRVLRQFRYAGFKVITKQDLLLLLKPPKSYNEYNLIRKVLLPAIEENKVHFENLRTNINDTSVLPSVIRFSFEPHDKRKGLSYDTQKTTHNEVKSTEVNSEEESLLEYIKANTQ